MNFLKNIKVYAAEARTALMPYLHKVRSALKKAWAFIEPHTRKLQPPLRKASSFMGPYVRDALRILKNIWRKVKRQPTWLKTSELSVVAVVLFSFLIVHFYLASPGRLEKHFRDGKEQTQSLQRSLYVINASGRLSDDHYIDTFTHDLRELSVRAAEYTYEQPHSLITSYALRDTPSRARDRTLLSDNNPTELASKIGHETTSLSELISILKPVLILRLRETQAENTYQNTISNALTQLDESKSGTEQLHKVLRHLLAEAEHYQATGNEERWLANASGLQAELRKEAVRIWEAMKKNLAISVSEHVSDYERLEYIFKSQ